MTDLQYAKQIVRALHEALDTCRGIDLARELAARTGPAYLWRGYHPFGELHGAETVAARFWLPLHDALRHMRRREDIFFAGTNRLAGDDGVWVVSMGHLMGLFDAPWLGLRPTGKLTFLRYASFDRVADGIVTDTAMFFDLPHMMAQAGQPAFAAQTGAHLVQPGPAGHDGRLLDPQPPAEGDATMDLIARMIADLGQWRSGLPLEDELARTWAPDMLWWGPEGIGATYTIARYAAQHARPFRSSFADRSSTSHVARVAEGLFGGFFGWPNFTARPTGGFMGMPGTGRSGEFRVIDIYRRNGDRLAENWVFIDLLHFWAGQGVDLLARVTDGAAPSVQGQAPAPMP
ncbi:ester cyclase [Meridianimarinicoccus sp. RP-17]|uniref:ester cyclase n=1 Tax=Meridianimarinicoccus zhengii TaxID=2056810 RepID=UPI000DACE89E|nr:ester cyclase [Phycocomes zhengii]